LQAVMVVYNRQEVGVALDLQQRSPTPTTTESTISWMLSQRIWSTTSVYFHLPKPFGGRATYPFRESYTV